MSHRKTYVGVVGGLKSGKHDEQYAVVHPADLDEDGIITFTLNPKIWKETKQPKPGDYVVMTNVHTRANGDRAESARFFTPNDRNNSDLLRQKQILDKRAQLMKSQRSKQ